MTVPFPTRTAASRAEVFSGYLNYFRSRLIGKIESMPPGAQRASIVPSGWTPVELLRQLEYVERRWLEWGAEGRDVGDPWGDRRDGRWYVGVTTRPARAARTAWWRCLRRYGGRPGGRQPPGAPRRAPARCAGATPVRRAAARSTSQSPR
jgi:hypothetical protein